MLSVFLAILVAQPGESARSELIEGVPSIVAPGSPGTVAPIGPRAFTFAYGRSSSGRAPVAAAGFPGQGRVVVFGHSGYLGAHQDEGTKRLLVNSVKWAGRGRAAVVLGNSELAGSLESEGISLNDEMNLAQLDPARHCLVMTGEGLASGEPEVLRRFLNAGGGLVTAATGWGWRQLNGDKPLSQMPLNRVLMPAGLLITGGFAEPAEGGRILPFTGDFTHLNAWHGLKRIKEGVQESARDDSEVVILAANALPAGSHPFSRELKALEQEEAGPLDLPITKDRPLDRLRLALLAQKWAQIPVEEIKACPTSSQFPGAVQEDEPRDEVTVTLPQGKEGWLSTGLYAPAGERVKVSLEAEGWTARIGAHSDQNWHHDEWDRSPEVSRTFPLQPGDNVLASAYGGLVYLVPPQVTSSPVTVAIEGAVRAPRFVKGQTSPQDWREQRTLPGPWAEIEGDRIIHTMPSEWVRTLNNPGAVANFWDQVMDACADLAQWPKERTRKERIVADAQISAGYMHAGYPIMTHLDTRQTVLDLDFLKKEGSWGHFHEIGHNFQSDDWTFEGTGEVTVNLFTLYVYDNVIKKRPDDRLFAGEDLEERMSKHKQDGSNYREWREDAFMALAIYMQMQERFGWSTFKRVFAEYRALPNSERPKSDRAKRDQWMTRFSRAAGTNLSPLFEEWNIPISQSAIDSLSDLPPWKFRSSH